MILWGKRQHGFTLIESLMASAVLAFVVMAIAQGVGSGQAETAAALQYLRGVALAESLMEEVLSKPYIDPAGVQTPGPETGETRLTFNCIDDYHGLSESANNIKDAPGNALPTEYQGFTRGVTCVYGSTTVAGLGAAISGITVTVTVTTSDGNNSWTITRFVPNPS